MDPDRIYQRALALARKGRKKNAKKVLPMLVQAADQGHAMAAHALATWYFFGIGVRRDLVRGVELEKQAARKGVPDAVYNLAHAYETGEGSPKNLRRAYLLYRRAATLGDSESVYEVGRCLFYGIGTKARRPLAMKWLLRTKEYQERPGRPKAQAKRRN